MLEQPSKNKSKVIVDSQNLVEPLGQQLKECNTEQ
jgi:hypothetical protein